MLLLLKAAFRTKKHFKYLIFSFMTLIGVTIANQLEMLTVGVIANNGTDFFTLFGDKEKVERGNIEEKWDSIDADKTGVITKKQAVSYLAKAKTAHPIRRYLNEIKAWFQNADHSLTKIVLALLLIALFKGIFLFFSKYSVRVLSVKISRDLRQQYFNHIQTLSLSFYQKYNIGSLSTRVVGDSSQIALSINSWIANYLHTPFTLITTLCLCFYFSWKLSMVIFFAMPMILLPVRILTKKVKKVSRVIQKNQEGFASHLIDFLAGIQTVKVFSMERFTFEKYSKQNDDMERLECKSSFYDLLTRPILHFVATVCLVLSLFIGLYILKIQLAELIVFCGLMHLFYDPIRRYSEENANIQRGVVAAERLFEVLNIKPAIQDKEGAIDISSFESFIEFDHVWFRYENEWVLKDVSFKVKKGETVAIVGATGSGKSTILQLLPRLYDVEKGEIRIDGRPLQDYTQASLRSLISYVPQKPFLFNDTIRANIIYGKELSDEKLLLAATRAHAHEFISEFPLQYESNIAEMGKNLSGGQQQRIAIARALAKDASILVLDEATSSLDSLSELKIKLAIDGLRGQMTQIIVAHRLSTIEHADRIIFINKGVKIAEGTIQQLLETCPEFKAMREASKLTEPDPIEQTISQVTI